MIRKILPVLFVSLLLLGGGVPAQAQGVPTGQGPLTQPVPPATSTTRPQQQRLTNPPAQPFGTQRPRTPPPTSGGTR
jgi:hypothetical protein